MTSFAANHRMLALVNRRLTGNLFHSTNTSALSNEDFFPSERMLKSTEAMCVARRRPRPQAMHEDFLDLQYVIISTSRRDESSRIAP